MGFSDLRRRKAMQWFKSADVDGDGKLTRRDATMMSERFITARGVSPDSPLARRLNEQMDNFWTNVVTPADSDSDKSVTPAEMTRAFAAALGGRAKSEPQIRLIGDLYFSLADADGDGRIDLAEFTDIFGAAGRASEAECAELFAKLDVDGSGTLSREEYQKTVHEFFYGDDPNAPANHLFGRVSA